MTTTQDIDDVKSFIRDRVITINLVELIEWYEGRIRSLEQQLNDAHLNNVERLFQGPKNE